MAKTIDERRHELLMLSPAEILDLWQRATGASDEDTAKKSYVMVQEVLDREFRNPEPRQE